MRLDDKELELALLALRQVKATTLCVRCARDFRALIERIEQFQKDVTEEKEDGDPA